MRNKFLSHASGVPRRMLVLALALMMPLALAASALATEPTGAFAVFKHCPLKNPATKACLFAQTESGEFKIKTTTVPIVNTITLQGGLPETGGDETPIAPENAEALSKTPQPVPGGLLNLIKCKEIKGEQILEKLARQACEAVFEKGPLGLNATAELVGLPTVNQTNLILEEGVALKLPIRVHLENSLLGPECYVGSPTNPIILNLTTGTTSPPPPNTPLKGSRGEVEGSEEGNLLTVKHNSLVDNAWAAPVATGCGGAFGFMINPIVNAKLGLPSAAGNNTAILNGTLRIATREGVEKSEK